MPLYTELLETFSNGLGPAHFDWIWHCQILEPYVNEGQSGSRLNYALNKKHAFQDETKFSKTNSDKKTILAKTAQAFKTYIILRLKKKF
jgi:hypothetical protein